jgi:CubicO group peptidase (beta-lactamase class C family)
LPTRRKGIIRTLRNSSHSACATLIALLGSIDALSVRADGVDDVIKTEMTKHHISGLSLAIINDGVLLKERGYGFTETTGGKPVTTSTLFQAASLSKPVCALAALHLVETGLLALDADVNTKLRTWSVPPNKFTQDSKVTLRSILSHSAGFTNHRFVGYAVGHPMPTLIQVLNGEKPANTSAVRVKRVPGAQWAYSGDGYLVMQQMITDATQERFPRFMDRTVLTPLGMASSTYVQPLPNDKAANAAKGYGPFFGRAVKGGWRVQPELAAAGLWTTAGDLARFVLGIQRSIRGKSNSVLSQSLTQQMLTRQQKNDGLGLFLRGSGKTLRFGHDGRNIGFDSALKAYAQIGKGAVVMINKNDNSGTIARIFAAIENQYNWPEVETSDAGR